MSGDALSGCGITNADRTHSAGNSGSFSDGAAAVLIGYENDLHRIRPAGGPCRAVCHEKLLDYRTQPCVAGRKFVADELFRMRQQPRPRELEFGSMPDFAEIGRVSVSYMLRLGADEARLGRVGDFIWLRLRVGKSFTDLVFHAKSKPRGARNAVSSTTRALLSSAVAR